MHLTLKLYVPRSQPKESCTGVQGSHNPVMLQALLQACGSLCIPSNEMQSPPQSV